MQTEIGSKSEHREAADATPIIDLHADIPWDIVHRKRAKKQGMIRNFSILESRWVGRRNFL